MLMHMKRLIDQSHTRTLNSLSPVVDHNRGTMSKRKAESGDHPDAATAAVQVTARPLVVGLGVACVDMIATVQQYPRPDEKIRAVEVDLYSGGNIGNTLTAISRLGAADTKVVTKMVSSMPGHRLLPDPCHIDMCGWQVVGSHPTPAGRCRWV